MNSPWLKFFSSDELLPLGEAFGWRSDFVWSFAVSDIALCLAFLSLGIVTYLITKRAKLPVRGVILGFLVFVGLQALWHLVSLFTIWEPWFWLAALTRVAAAVSGCISAVWVLQYWKEIVNISLQLKSDGDQSREQGERHRREHFSNEQFEKLLKRSVFLPIAMSLILIIVLTSQITYIVDVKSQVAALTASVTRLSAFQRRFSESENAVRGYILTKDRLFLDSFFEAQSRVPIIIGRLMEDTKGKAEWNSAVTALHSIHTVWLENSFKIQDLVSQGKEIPLESIMAQRAQLMKSKEIFTSTVNKVISARDDYSENADHATYLFILVTVSLSGLVGVLLAFWSRRQIVNLSRVYTKALEATHQFNLRLEQKVIERTRDLEEANLALSAVNSELEAFSYSVSHDLRGPLRGIDGFSRILVEDYEQQFDEAGKKHIAFIRDGVRKMGQLIDDLLKLSRLTRADVTVTEVDASRMAREILQQLQATDPSRKTQFEVPKELKVFADENLLRIVLENLLNNAWKFTSKKTETVITIEPMFQDGFSGFALIDNGAGFDMNFQKKLFQAFQRLHSARDFEGTGVGLALCKRIVQKHGGRISGSAQLGQGARFEVLLPVRSH